MITLAKLFIYPVKSMRGTQLSHTLVEETGLTWDRHFMLTLEDGTFITARKYPELLRFTPTLSRDGLYLRAPDLQHAWIRIEDFAEVDAPTEVWGNHFTAKIAPDSINRWLSHYFPHPVQLRWIGNTPQRKVTKRPEHPLSFADGYPFLLINDSSLHDLQNRCPAGVAVDQFRANLVVSGASPWEEDHWSVIRVGEIIFDVAKPCSRCILTTINSQTARKHPSGEPMRSLAQFREAADGSGDIDFGINLIARNSGIIQVGEQVAVLQRKPPRSYLQKVSQAGVEAPPVLSTTVRDVEIAFSGRHFIGNNQQILLEQLEQQGFSIPYSCRMGSCGSCRLSKISGEVTAMNANAVSDSTLLSCCCIPNQGPLQLEID
ncbi:MOSC domain-containing protein [Rosenbergiella collisarenosi]|uniref:YcbX family protein n=1 Tax=Rosenbergiella collisarenosi TaxID=1544695 RepID=UPI001BD94D30|nr:MOSC N-terminal beta barrel domain-containing protein [Rosenbergiella collisarenosi]MBT0722037.1 MOSC domain-containing protein [Rosenbergiella collisarenosi]